MLSVSHDGATTRILRKTVPVSRAVSWAGAAVGLIFLFMAASDLRHGHVAAPLVEVLVAAALMWALVLPTSSEVLIDRTSRTLSVVTLRPLLPRRPFLRSVDEVAEISLLAGPGAQFADPEYLR
jgi:hypothetical protein